MSRRSPGDKTQGQSTPPLDSESVQGAVDGIFGGLGKLSARLGEVAELAGTAIEEAKRRQEAGETSNQSGVVYDVSVRMGLGDPLDRPQSPAASRGPDVSKHQVSKHQVSRHGATKNRASSNRDPKVSSGVSTSPPPAVSSTDPSSAREPYSEVTVDGEKSIIILDMPGVKASDVEVRQSPNRLEVEAQGSGRNWFKRLDVPGLSAEDTVYVTATNGLVRLETCPSSSALVSSISKKDSESGSGS